MRRRIKIELNIRLLPPKINLVTMFYIYAEQRIFKCFPVATRKRRSWLWMLSLVILSLISFSTLAACRPPEVTATGIGIGNKFNSTTVNEASESTSQTLAAAAVVAAPKHRRHQKHSNNHQRTQGQTQKYKEGEGKVEELDDNNQRSTIRLEHSQENYMSDNITEDANNTELFLEELNLPDGFWFRVAQAKAMALVIVSKSKNDSIT